MKHLLLVGLLSIAPWAAIAQNDTPDKTPKAAANPVVRIKTSMGDILVELWPKQAPKTVKNFIALAEGTKEWTDPKTRQKVTRPLYDGLIFHRVIKGFMLQGGCPLGTGSSEIGYRFEDEINATSLGLHNKKLFGPDQRINPAASNQFGIRQQQDFNRVVVLPLCKKLGFSTNETIKANWQEKIVPKLLTLTFKDVLENQGYKFSETLPSSHPKKGVIAMANAGPNTNGSQFFINLIDTPWLAGRHTVFGRVIKGMEIVEKIGEVPVGGGARPTTDVKIVSIRQLGKPEAERFLLEAQRLLLKAQQEK